MEMRLFIGVGRKHIEAEHHIGFGELGRRLEAAPVNCNRLHHLRGCKMRGKRKRQTQCCCQLRAEQAGAQNPQRHLETRARHRAYRLARRAGEVIAQLHHVARKAVGIRIEGAAQRARCDLVRARRTAQAEINPPPIQRLERAELLGNHQRRMVGQHDAARTHANTRGAARYMTDQHRRGGAGDAGHAMVLGQPEAVVTPALGMLGQIE